MQSNVCVCALTTLQSTTLNQMRGKYFILNFASNFQMLLQSLVVHGGCGFTPHPIIICLEEQAARFKICLGYAGSDFQKCMRDKKAVIMATKGKEKRRRRLQEVLGI